MDVHALESSDTPSVNRSLPTGESPRVVRRLPSEPSRRGARSKPTVYAPVVLDGVVLKSMQMHRDLRGHVTELFRVDWASELGGLEPAQWHILASSAGTLRGMHAHARHDDFKIVLHGRVTLALKDLRPWSSTYDGVDLLELSAEDYTGVFIPAGVAHGVLAHTDSLVLVGVTALYDGTDEYQCDWADPELGVDWPVQPTLLSKRDDQAGSLRELKATLESRLTSALEV